MQTVEQRLPVLKTYKIYVGGKFPRTESGRYYVLSSARGQAVANICDCSRKDFRDAVVAARAAQSPWAGRSAYNRGQILYRIAEMLEGRASQFVEELALVGVPASAAVKEVQASIDRWLYYAGWADKYQQVFSCVNPVASSHFNFSVLEPMGVVAIVAPETTGLIGLTSVVAPAIVGGNTCIALASHSKPHVAVTFAEVLASSDLPGGVVNILTGRRSELLEHMASHMDVNAIVYCGDDPEQRTLVRSRAALNVKRAIIYDRDDWISHNAQGPYFILDTQEVKTTWHPIGV
ncbi:MAG TPA: aldehyde dehydrogenase family protein [Tepidisphaeraceae bacterium]|nr:aldehyde dehydrogenase family protein [Tepidisphaeraceae bacterium]